jgi:predicted TIM-barrel fold metal-dependent hydrolase
VAAEDTPAFDCDVHCVVPDKEALGPYLSDHWREYLRFNNFRGSDSIALTYPSWSTMIATPPSSVDEQMERIEQAVLERADAAILTCYYGVESIPNPDLSPALASAVNSWIAAEWLDRDRRLLGSAVLPTQQTDAAVKEIERIGADRRFVQVLLPARAWSGYGDRRYWPIWEAAAEYGLVLAIAYGGGAGVPPTSVNYMDSFYEDMVMAAQAFQTHVTSLVFSGAFQRWPSLKVTIAESGVSWLPGLTWRMDQEWRALVREVPWIVEEPSAYVRRHFRFTTQPFDCPPSSEQLRHLLGQLEAPEELLMYSSDHPHRYEPSDVERLLAEFSSDGLRQVMSGNAASWYRAGLPVAP